MRWGIYTRISDDRDASSRGVTRQEADARARIAALGDELAGVYCENDTSAYRKQRVGEGWRVVRPVWQDLLRDLRSGAVDGALVYDLDRLARDPRDLEDAIEVVQHYGRRIESVVPGALDLTSDGGIAQARVLIAMAAKSSADTGRRVRDAHRHNAQAGVPVGGTRPFGWLDDKRTLHPVEAPILRRMVHEAGNGESLAAITIWLNAEGVLTSRGKFWTRTAVKTVVTNPRICGLRTYLGEILPDVRGAWEPICSREEYDKVADRHTRRAERQARPSTMGHGVGRKYLLSGCLRCGRCGAKLGGNKQRDTFNYRCQAPVNGGCGGLSVDGPRTDAAVTELVLAYLERERPESAPAVPWPRADELAAVQAQLAETREAFRTRALSGASAFPLIAEFEQEIAELQAARRAHDREHTHPVRVTADIRKAWDSATLSGKREIVARVLAAVDVAPSTAARYDLGRLSPVFAS